MDLQGVKIYRGQLNGYSESAVRVMDTGERWQGIIVLEDKLYRIDTPIENDSERAMRPMQAMAVTQADLDKGQCAMLAGYPGFSGHSNHSGHEESSANMMASQTSFADYDLIAYSTSTSGYCSNPVDGVCLLPEIEFVYDTSYQALDTNPTARALNELNQLDLFFELSLEMRFSHISMTFLTPSDEDAMTDHYFGDNTHTINDINSSGDMLIAARLARRDGIFGFLQSSNTIMHFVSGRDFPAQNGNKTLGVAYTDTHCDPVDWDFNVGLTDAGAASLVSLVIAHEIGHNMGAGHDSIDNACPASANIMTPVFNGSSSLIDDFSSCSQDEISQHITPRLSTSCMDFPVDIAICQAEDNIELPPKDENFTSQFEIKLTAELVAAPQFEIDGVITQPLNGDIISVSLQNGAGSCTNTASDYNCTVTNPSIVVIMNVETRIDAAAVDFEITHSIYLPSGDAIDLIDSNDSITQTFSSFSSSGLSSYPEIDPADACDQNVTGFLGANIVDNAFVTIPQATTSGSGSGGGSIHIAALLLLLSRLFFLRFLSLHQTRKNQTKFK